MDTGPADTGPAVEVDPLPPLTLTEDALPPGVSVPDGTFFTADVAYDVHAKTTFDAFLPQSAEPTPVVIFIHGGGFTSSRKEVLYQNDPGDVAEVLERGWALLNVNYRTLDPVDTEGVIKPLSDSQRALQFARAYHELFNIDPDRIAVYGTSAGSGTGLWLGTHDDMADLGSSDPILRASTRLSAVGVQGSQSTYDLLYWPEIFADYDLTLEGITEVTSVQRVLSFYGVGSSAELETPEIEAYRANVDMLSLIDGDDAPLWIYTKGPDDPPEDEGVLFHSPLHADAVRQRALAVGLEEVSNIQALGIEDPSGETMWDFFARQFE